MKKKDLSSIVIEVFLFIFIFVAVMFAFVKWTDELRYVRNSAGEITGIERPPHKGESMKDYIIVKKGTQEFEILNGKVVDED